METSLIKIDSNGRYCRFPGITIVSAIRSEDLEIWTQLYNQLEKCENLKEYYSLLPVESYHMTTSGLYNQKRDGGSNWEGLLNEKLPQLRQLNKTLSEKAFSPEIIIDSLSLRKIGITLYLKLKEEHRQIIQEVAEKFGLADKVPKSFHISLAYTYKVPAEDKLKEMKKQLKSSVDCIGKTFKLDSPKLCYYNDMTAFIPWDTEKSPFH